MRYRAKPLVIDAVLWTGSLDSIPGNWLGDSQLMPDGTDLVIQTLEGPTRAEADGHYVVRGTAGEFYPVRRDIFEDKYEAVNE